MIFRLLIAGCLFSTSYVFAQGRAPAVEDFVGIEMDREAAPRGEESLFNLEKDISKVSQAQKNKVTPTMYQAPSTDWSWGTIVAVMLAIGLPVLSWLVVLNHLKRQAQSENASNIEVLENYRKKREAEKSKDIRKAS